MHRAQCRSLATTLLVPPVEKSFDVGCFERGLGAPDDVRGANLYVVVEAVKLLPIQRNGALDGSRVAAHLRSPLVEDAVLASPGVTGAEAVPQVCMLRRYA